MRACGGLGASGFRGDLCFLVREARLALDFCVSSMQVLRSGQLHTGVMANKCVRGRAYPKDKNDTKLGPVFGWRWSAVGLGAGWSSILLGDSGDLDTAGGVEHALDVSIDEELAGSEGTDHDETGTHAGEETLDTELLGHLDEARGGRLAGGTLGLVDLGEEGVGGLRDDGGGHTGDETGAEVEAGLLTLGKRGLGAAHGVEDLLRGDLEDGELGHGVGDLLEQDGAETGVEAADTLLTGDAEEARGEAVGERGLRDETDTGGLEGAESNVGEELGDTRGTEVDGLAVLRGLLDTEVVDGLLLPELVSTELQGTLDGVTGDGGAETGEEGTSTLVLDDLTEGVDHTLVVDLGLKLDTGLDDIDGGKGTVGDGTSESTGKGETEDRQTSACFRSCSPALLAMSFRSRVFMVVLRGRLFAFFTTTIGVIAVAEQGEKT